MSEDAWEWLGIDESDLKRCKLLAQTKTTKKARGYWKECFYIIKYQQYRPYDRVTTSQRKWIVKIKNDLLKEFKL